MKKNVLNKVVVLTDFSIDSWKVVRYALNFSTDSELYILCHTPYDPQGVFSTEFNKFARSVSDAYNASLISHVLSGDLTFELGKFTSSKKINTLIIPKVFVETCKIPKDVDYLLNKQVIII